MSRIRFWAAALGAVLAAAADGAVDLRVTQDGGVSFDGGRIAVSAFLPEWAGAAVKVDWTNERTDVKKFTVVDGARTLFEGRGRWTAQPDGTVKGLVALQCVTPVEMQCVSLAASIPAPPPIGLGDGTAARYTLPVGTAAGGQTADAAAGGRTIEATFAAPVAYHAQDSRRWGCGWSVRFGGHLGRRTYAAGDLLKWEVTLSAPDGLTLKQAARYEIRANDDWVALDYRKDIVAGSALDLSGQGLQDAPAGKHGWLKRVGGRFEFEGRPGVEQRFYGVNLCFDANYLPHADADMLVERLVRYGYNTIRVHHHDGAWAASAENREKLDYLIARAIARGLYITTDLYVSRPVKWRAVGIDRDGDMPKQLYKTYVGLHEPAFRDWCAFAREFLEHVNPYTGRAYKDEPGMPLVSLINEGGLFMGWDDKKDDPIIAAAWRASGGEGAVPHPWHAETRDAFRAFDDAINRKIWENCSAFVRSLGAKALLTNDNNGRAHGEGESLTSLYDYCDNHFYVDHPSFLEKSWRLPSRCANVNPIPRDQPSLLHRGYAKDASRPYTITEWNFSGPGRYRAMGGILTGALAAEQDWDGLWRFAYSHSRHNLRDSPHGGPGYFDCATDPLSAASDRASVCLYLRRDAAEGALRTDKATGAMTLVTPRTCGGFTEGGELAAGPLVFRPAPDAANGRIVPMTLWASSLDGKPLADSARLVLTHLTDVQGDGTRYADDTRTVLLKWGRGCLIEAGAADVRLTSARADRLKVYELDTAGRRTGAVAATAQGGVLSFRVSTRGPRGGRLAYELVAEDAPAAPPAPAAPASLANLKWTLTRFARLEGTRLVVDVPPDRAAEGGNATAEVDLSAFAGKAFEATVTARGERISEPEHRWNGLKFQFQYKDAATGDMRYPNTAARRENFPEQKIAVIDRQTERVVAGGKARLVLGLQESSGRVEFDLATLDLHEPRAYWPVTNQTHRAVYTPAVAARGVRRGVMSPSRPMTEDDFATLHAWGATLLRYQMIRFWHGVDTNQDLDEYDRWLDGKLDHFDAFILPQAQKHGMLVVLDLHVPPGGRDVSRDMNMFYDAKFADHFVAVWRRIAARFKGRAGIYGYDLINEPTQTREPLPGCDYWSLQNRAAAAVRAIDPDVPIILEANQWDSAAAYAYLSPLTLTNVIYQVHMYDPGEFTHQGVAGRADTRRAWPDPARKWDADYIRRKLAPVFDFQKRHGARIYVGEFSATAWAPGADAYLRDCIRIFEDAGWDWTYHAFREAVCWSVEHAGEDKAHLRPAADTPRRRALIDGLRAGRPQPDGL